MGRPFRQYLNGSRIYSCNTCRCHSADAEDVESKVRELWTGALLADSAGLISTRPLAVTGSKHYVECVRALMVDLSRDL